MTATTHDPRLREALITLARFEADRAVLLAERERDRQRIRSLEYHLESMRAANRRRQRRAQAGSQSDCGTQSAGVPQAEAPP